MLLTLYQEFYYQVVVASRRVKDPYTGASLYFTPHCFRHSFATALAPLIGGDAKTGAKILGHSPQTFMRYVRANDDTARGAIEKMVQGLPEAGEPPAAPATVHRCAWFPAVNPQSVKGRAAESSPSPRVRALCVQ